MKVKGKRRTIWWLLAIVVLGLAVWGWRILNAPLPKLPDAGGAQR
ncbi:macrolide-specific efflux protein MacA [Klebsiella variicola]|uniref:Macrolide-specific efflux protein MacA n=1 Tax=Klebsiella variicola TaxID=244366 RepID=A0A7H4MGM1_KLEVA|nr:macrolide-specific efflux protein MacA [Klebsiella variicola]